MVRLVQVMKLVKCHISLETLIEFVSKQSQMLQLYVECNEIRVVCHYSTWRHHFEIMKMILIFHAFLLHCIFLWKYSQGPCLEQPGEIPSFRLLMTTLLVLKGPSCEVSLQYTAISRKVVGRSARDNPERYCGWF